MKWWLSKANDSTGNFSGNGSMEEAIRQSIMLTSVQSLLAWGRKNSMWPFHFGLSCCFVEMATAITAGLSAVAVRPCCGVAMGESGRDEFYGDSAG